MFLPIGFNLFSAKDCHPQQTCYAFLNSFWIRENFCVKNLINIKVKVIVVTAHVMVAYKRSNIHSQLHIPSALLLGKKSVIHCISCCVGPRARLNVLEKR